MVVKRVSVDTCVNYYFDILIALLILLSIMDSNKILLLYWSYWELLVLTNVTFMIYQGCKTDSDCHGHGTCNQESGKCGCIDGYTGNTCEVSGKCDFVDILD